MQTESVDSETSSSVESHSQQGVSTVGAAADTRGRHRILAELKRLEQETRFLEEELAKLEETENVSTTCQELLHNIETIPDPLLPLTNGPANAIWDRWFEGAQDSQDCGCSIL